MTRSPNTLVLARVAIRGLTVLNALYAFAIAALLVATLIKPQFLFDALGARYGHLHNALRAVVLLGIVGAYLVHRVLRELLAIVDTVRDGDPFAAGNSRRLQAIAWWVLAGEGVRLLIATVVYAAAKASPGLKMDIDVGFSFAPWLAVLLLFVLARVFEQGARMRTDLDGTV